MDPENQPVVSQGQGKSFWQKYKFTFISLCIILLAAVPLLLLSNTASKQKIPQQVTVTPSSAPVNESMTSANADTILSQTDASVESALNQADTDIQTQSQIDSSQDSTNGL